ncbi:MAG: signal peptidase I, partial [Lachnospiraceae bacterium]|nr:signal peptidase I [Lachnospiraceae bacterium]
MKLKKIAKTIGNILGYVVMAVLIAITAFVMISNARGEVPFLGKYSVMWVLTESMEPEIPARSNILIEK